MLRGASDMSSDLSPFSIFPGGQPIRGGDASSGREYQELWLSIARMDWASVVLVPTDNGGSAADLATMLAGVGTQLRDTPVTAIVAHRIDYASVRALANLQPRLQSGLPWPGAIEVAPTPVDPAEPEPAPRGRMHEAFPMPPLGRAIVAIPPIVDEPLGVAVAQAADAVVLCIRLGKTQITSARRTIDLIGADRVIGAVLVR